jgi:two-component system response regulator GlrR
MGVRWIGAWDGIREEFESRSEILSQEIYESLKPVVLKIPSLKERPEDILPMARQFAERSFQAQGLLFEGFSAYWEERLLGSDGPSTVEDLARQMEELPFASSISEVGYRSFKKTFSHDFETKYLAQLLTKTGGNVSQSARLAQLDRSNFLRLLRKHDLKSEVFRKKNQEDLK